MRGSCGALQVRCIETSIELCHRLKQEVGSFALMAGTGFERLDYLQCCKVTPLTPPPLLGTTLVRPLTADALSMLCGCLIPPPPLPLLLL